MTDTTPGKDTTEVRTFSSTGGAKGVKIARYDLIPAAPLYELACLYGVGALKYDERNFEAGYEWSKSFGAMQRHAWLFWNGEDIDPETGCHHLASVVWNAMALMLFTQTHTELDDRPQSVQMRRPSNEHIAIMRELGERFRAETGEITRELQERLAQLPEEPAVEEPATAA